MILITILIQKIKYKLSEFAFRRKVAKMGGFAGRPLALINPQNIIVGRNVRIKNGYRIECYENFYNQNFSPKLILDDGVIINYGFTAFVACSLRIGKDSILAGNVTIITENHGMNPEDNTPYHAQPLSIGEVSIGEGCWLGQNVSILPNVHIGKKCIIATNAVVVSDIPDYSIVAGIPAKVIKKYDFTNHSWVNTYL